MHVYAYIRKLRKKCVNGAKTQNNFYILSNGFIFDFYG